MEGPHIRSGDCECVDRGDGNVPDEFSGGRVLQVVRAFAVSTLPLFRTLLWAQFVSDVNPLL